MVPSKAAPVAPVAPVVAPKPAPSPWGDWDGKKPLKVKIGDEDVEFANLDALTRGVATHKWGNKANEKAAQLERQMKALEAAAAEGDEALMRALKVDPDKWYASRLEADIAREKMSAEERAQADAKKATDSAEARAKKAESELAARLQHEQEARRWREMEPRLKAAYESSDMLKDERSLKEISDIGKLFAKAGLNLTPEQIIAEAADQQRETFHARVKTLSADDAERLLPDTVIAELSKRRVQKWQAARNPGAPPPAAKPPAPAPKDKELGYSGSDEAREKFGFRW